MEGATLDGRYQLLREIGSGSFADVWHAMDLTTQRHVALKILKTVDCTDYGEVSVLTKLAQEAEGTRTPVQVRGGMQPGPAMLASHTLKLLDSFSIAGPDGGGGSKTVLVTERLSVSLSDLIDIHVLTKPGPPPPGLPPTVVKRLARGLLAGLAELHRLRLVHTDVRPENCACLPSPFYLPSKQQVDGFELGLCPDPFQAKLIDMGNVLPLGQLTDTITMRPEEQVQSREYRAPECILRRPFGTSADIWSTGAVIYELLTGQMLFQPSRCSTGWAGMEDDGCTESDLDWEHLAIMQALLGRFPDALVMDGTCAAGLSANTPLAYFDQNRGLVLPRDGTGDSGGEYDSPCPPDELEALRQRMSSVRPDLGIQEIELTASFLAASLTLDPDRRWTAERLLSHPWMAFGADDYTQDVASLGLAVSEEGWESFLDCLAVDSSRRDDEVCAAVMIQAAYRGHVSRRDSWKREGWHRVLNGDGGEARKEHGQGQEEDDEWDLEEDNSANPSQPFLPMQRADAAAHSLRRNISPSVNILSNRGSKLSLFSVSKPVDVPVSVPVSPTSKSQSQTKPSTSCRSRDGLERTQSALQAWHAASVAKWTDLAACSDFCDGDLPLWFASEGSGSGDSAPFVDVAQHAQLQHRQLGRQLPRSSSPRRSMQSTVSSGCVGSGRDSALRIAERDLQRTRETLIPVHEVASLGSSLFSTKVDAVNRLRNHLLGDSKRVERSCGALFDAAAWLARTYGSGCSGSLTLQVLVAELQSFPLRSNFKCVVALLGLIGDAVAALPPRSLRQSTADTLLSEFVLPKLSDAKAKPAARKCLCRILRSALIPPDASLDHSDAEIGFDLGNGGGCTAAVLIMRLCHHLQRSKHPQVVVGGIECLRAHLVDCGVPTEAEDLCSVLARFLIGAVTEFQHPGSGGRDGTPATPRPSAVGGVAVACLELLMRVAPGRFPAALAPSLESLTQEQPSVAAFLFKAVPAFAALRQDAKDRSLETADVSAKRVASMRCRWSAPDAPLCPAQCTAHIVNDELASGKPCTVAVQCRAGDGGILGSGTGKLKVKFSSEGQVVQAVSVLGGLMLVTFVCDSSRPLDMQVCDSNGVAVAGSPWTLDLLPFEHVLAAADREVFVQAGDAAHFTLSAPSGALMVVETCHESLTSEVMDLGQGRYQVVAETNQAKAGSPADLQVGIFALEVEPLLLTIHVLSGPLHMPSSQFHLLLTGASSSMPVAFVNDTATLEARAGETVLSVGACDSCGNEISARSCLGWIGSMGLARHSSTVWPSMLPWVRCHATYEEDKTEGSTSVTFSVDLTFPRLPSAAQKEIPPDGQLLYSVTIPPEISQRAGTWTLAFECSLGNIEEERCSSELQTTFKHLRLCISPGPPASCSLPDDNGMIICRHVSQRRSVMVELSDEFGNPTTTSSSHAIFARLLGPEVGEAEEQLVAGWQESWVAEKSGDFAAAEAAAAAAAAKYDVRNGCACWRLRVLSVAPGSCEVLLPLINTRTGNDYQLEIMHSVPTGDHVQGSPFPVTVVEPGVCPARCGVEGKPARYVGECNRVVVVSRDATGHPVQLGDGDGEFQAVLYSEDHPAQHRPDLAITLRPVPGEDGTMFEGLWTVDSSGMYSLEVTLVSSSSSRAHIGGSPFCGLAWTDAVWCPVASRVYGNGLQKATVGVDAQFTVEGRDARGNALSHCGARFRVSISGPTKTETTLTAKGGGIFVASFCPTMSGSYTVSITLSGNIVAQHGIIVGDGMLQRPSAGRNALRNPSPARRKVLAEFADRRRQALRQEANGQRPAFCLKF